MRYFAAIFRKIYYMKQLLSFLLTVLCSVYCISVEAQSEKNDAKIPVEWNFDKYRFGGYGEILFQHMNYGANRYKDPSGAISDNRSYITIPRTIFALDYKFRDDIVLGTEIEFEYGGTGAAMELEYSEAGEYEMEIEKAGEVALEQFHLTKRFCDGFNIRVGHMIVPVGLTNAHHEPIFFFGTTRPEGEVALLPSTWHETGIAVLGYLSSFRYELMLVNGLDPNGFSTANWVGSGKQGIFEQVIATDPAVAGRVEYSGVKGLRVGVSGYYGNSAKNSSKPQNMTGLKGTVSILSSDAQYNAHHIIARANFIYGNLADSKAISDVNRLMFKKTGYPITEVAKNAMTYAVEAGYDIFSFWGLKEKLYPFVRYEYYNTAEKLEAGVKQQPRYKRDLKTAGINYQILPNLVVKADYSIRRIDAGNYNDEHTLGVGVAYTGWFIKK
jgi:hypothetical protein